VAGLNMQSCAGQELARALEALSMYNLESELEVVLTRVKEARARVGAGLAGNGGHDRFDEGAVASAATARSPHHLHAQQVGKPLQPHPLERLSGASPWCLWRGAGEQAAFRECARGRLGSGASLSLCWWSDSRHTKHVLSSSLCAPALTHALCLSLQGGWPQRSTVSFEDDNASLSGSLYEGERAPPPPGPTHVRSSGRSDDNAEEEEEEDDSRGGGSDLSRSIASRSHSRREGREEESPSSPRGLLACDLGTAAAQVSLALSASPLSPSLSPLASPAPKRLRAALDPAV
jgi:hypothetical protein